MGEPGTSVAVTNAINWIDGRGKSVVCEAIIPEKVSREGRMRRPTVQR